MEARDVEEMEVDQYIIRFRSVLTTRFDTKRFKEAMGEDVYNAFTKYKTSTFTTNRKAKAFNIFSGEERIVKMRFLNTLADTVIDEFGKDTTLVPIDDNHFEIAKLVRTNPQFYSWIAMFGKRAQIISPPEVVEEMKMFSEKIYDMYHSR